MQAVAARGLSASLMSAGRHLPSANARCLVHPRRRGHSLTNWYALVGRDRPARSPASATTCRRWECRCPPTQGLHTHTRKRTCANTKKREPQSSWKPRRLPLPTAVQANRHFCKDDIRDTQLGADASQAAHKTRTARAKRLFTDMSKGNVTTTMDQCMQHHSNTACVPCAHVIAQTQTHTCSLC